MSYGKKSFADFSKEKLGKFEGVGSTLGKERKK